MFNLATGAGAQLATGARAGGRDRATRGAGGANDGDAASVFRGGSGDTGTAPYLVRRRSSGPDPALAGGAMAGDMEMSRCSTGGDPTAVAAGDSYNVPVRRRSSGPAPDPAVAGAAAGDREMDCGEMDAELSAGLLMALRSAGRR